MYQTREIWQLVEPKDGSDLVLIVGPNSVSSSVSWNSDVVFTGVSGKAIFYPCVLVLKWSFPIYWPVSMDEIVI